MSHLVCSPALSIVVIDDSSADELPPYVRLLLLPEDTVRRVERPTNQGLQRADLVLLSGAILPEVIERLAGCKVPVLVVAAHHGFDDCHAESLAWARYRGLRLLPSFTPDELQASLAAVRARVALRGQTLLAIRLTDDEFRNELHERVVSAMRRIAGVKIVSAPIDELQDRAAHFNARAVRTELTRWREDLLAPGCELSAEHQEQVVRLYLAERLLLDVTNAIGLTIDDVCGFQEQAAVMPSASYGILAEDGYLACEEGDTGALASQLLLWAATGQRPTMNTISFAYRQGLTTCRRASDYDAARQQADLLQCLRDHRITASQFSTSGTLPPEFRREARPRWVEMTPRWPGQSTLAATMPLGPVAIARLSLAADRLHLVPGEVDGYGHGDQFGWWRGRTFIRLPDARAFAEQMEHHHYAIGRADSRAFTTCRLLTELLGLASEASRSSTLLTGSLT